MKLIQRANKQLRIADDRLEEYKKQGYKEVKTTPPAPKFTCPVCGNEYATESGLSKHLKEKHPEYNPDNAAGGA